MSQMRSFTRSSRVGRPYAAGSSAKSRAVEGFILGAFCNLPGKASADQASGVGVRQLLELLAAQRRLEQLHQGAFTREKRCMRAEHQPLNGDRTAITVVFSLDEPADAAVSFGGRNVKRDLRVAHQGLDVVTQ